VVKYKLKNYENAITREGNRFMKKENLKKTKEFGNAMYRRNILIGSQSL
jgi:hypothetical protein